MKLTVKYVEELLHEGKTQTTRNKKRRKARGSWLVLPTEAYSHMGKKGQSLLLQRAQDFNTAKQKQPISESLFDIDQENSVFFFSQFQSLFFDFKAYLSIKAKQTTEQLFTIVT